MITTQCVTLSCNLLQFTTRSESQWWNIMSACKGKHTCRMMYIPMIQTHTQTTHECETTLVNQWQCLNTHTSTCMCNWCKTHQSSTQHHTQHWTKQTTHTGQDNTRCDVNSNICRETQHICVYVSAHCNVRKFMHSDDDTRQSVWSHSWCADATHVHNTLTPHISQLQISAEDSAIWSINTPTHWNNTTHDTNKSGITHEQSDKQWHNYQHVEPRQHSCNVTWLNFEWSCMMHESLNCEVGCDKSTTHLVHIWNLRTTQ